jgi:hypothetical protein
MRWILIALGAAACGGGSDTGTDAAVLPDAPSTTPTIANVWVDLDGGSCTRSATPAEYVDADACGSFDAAWDVASAGDTIVVKAGTYGPQSITGGKASETHIIGEPGTRTGKLEIPTATHLTLGTMIADSADTHDGAIEVGADDVTLRGVSIYGAFTRIYVDGVRFAWHGGSVGEDGTTGGARRCSEGDSEPVWLSGDNATIDGVRFNPQKAAFDDSTCGSDNVFHLENIRIQGAANVTVKSSWFLPGSDAGSGHIFITTTAPDDVQPTGFRLENNVMEPVEGSFVLQQHSNVQSCADYVIAYNTLHQELLFQCGTTAGMQWIGNLGPKGGAGCDGTYVRNVWQHDVDVACGSDTWVDGPRYEVSMLGLAADGQHLAAGSPAIDAAEMPGDSDYCTGALGSLDREGNGRPAGGACDAGAHELH